MIASLHGTLIHIGADHLVVETGGVGWLVFAPRPLLASLEVGREIRLLTHMIVREDALQLYGFAEAPQRALFETLLGVTGVGPRVALSLLSAGPLDEMRLAIAGGDTARLSRVPGIGKKLAERIVLELRGKLEISGLAPVAGAPTGPAPVNREVIAALVNLGFSAAEATSAVNQIPRETPDDFDTRLRLALRFFGGA